MGELLPENWGALVEEQLATGNEAALDREVAVGGRIISWSLFAVRPQGVVHGYGQDVTEGRRAELALKQQAELNEYQALHDSLTGLGNRRRMIDEAQARLSQATPAAPLVLAIFDLDGFKSYNDTFGHPAGDALLARLGQRLQASLPSDAAGFRIGGDEFCLLARCDQPDVLVAGVTAALTEGGEKFSITASVGFVIVPTEATSVVHALQLADQRLYIDKRSSRASAGFQARDALVQVLIESDSRFADHTSNVAQLAAATAIELGLRGEDIARVRLAADLHDIGKAAIPDTILDKPGPLDPEEWRFMRTHTLIGERILAAAPALTAIAPLVRSSHERVDGTGYPDGLSGQEIPLLSRIVAVADAFDAMTADRPYRRRLSVEAALAELQRCAATQFDPDVVAAFNAAVLDHSRQAA
jgi:diguanylate cyclase (GGDEF)-like protein